MKKDYIILRELAKKTLEVANQPVQNQRRKLWADVNSLRTHEVPVYILDAQAIWHEVRPELECEDAYLREHENWLRFQLYHSTFGDDFVTEKYITMRPVYDNTSRGWTLPGGYTERIHFAARMRDYIDVTMEDIEKLPVPQLAIDEQKTSERRELLEDAFGGEITIYIRDKAQLAPCNPRTAAGAFAVQIDLNAGIATHLGDGIDE